MLPRFNLQPINQVVFLGPSFPFWVGRSHLRACFPAYMHSAVITTELRYPSPCPWSGQLEHKRFVHPGPLVLRTALFKSPTPTADRDRTVSRRSEPSSRTTLIGEQPNPWNLLQLQDVMSRHRGAKPKRRYELSWLRSACYPRRTFYPLSDGPSIQNHRITKACFRICSTCRSRS